MSFARVAHLGMLALGCTVGGGNDQSPADDDPVIGASAGGETNVISDNWEVASVRAGNNMKMLNFEQMQAEVLRATKVSYADWAANRDVFGAPDFQTSFQDDRTPTTTKILTWRKIAYAVCGEMIKKETATPTLFSSIAPTAAIDAADPKVIAQVKAIFTRFLFEAPTSSEVEASTKALVDTVAAGSSTSEAWTSLCVSYLSSMRFLTY